MKVIILIPCLNEAQSIAKTLADLPQHINGVDVIEPLIIDDGSTDGTADVARQCGVTEVVRLTKNKGLAKAFHAGLDSALKRGADIIVNFDADGQYKGEDIPRIIQPILEGKSDIVIGNRDIENVRQFSFIKKRLQRLGTWVIRQLTGTKIEDATTGFRAYNREAALRINIVSDYTYTIESIIQAEHMNLAIANITVATNDVKRPSRLLKSTTQYIKRSLVTIIRIYSMFNPLRLFLTFGGLFVFIGFLIGCRFLYFYLLTGGTGKIQSLILAAISIIIGFQLMIIGLVSDLISANRRLIEDILLRVKKIELNSKK